MPAAVASEGPWSAVSNYSRARRSVLVIKRLERQSRRSVRPWPRYTRLFGAASSDSAPSTPRRTPLACPRFRSFSQKNVYRAAHTHCKLGGRVNPRGCGFRCSPSLPQSRLAGCSLLASLSGRAPMRKGRACIPPPATGVLSTRGAGVRAGCRYSERALYCHWGQSLCLPTHAYADLYIHKRRYA